MNVDLPYPPDSGFDRNTLKTVSSQNFNAVFRAVIRLGMFMTKIMYFCESDHNFK